ncbi:hypothetical protein B0H14DRAFT_2576318 [Mycena olivaceomarginata]|nr:hypothetical protein B0H14DRAFT_2576318 [Mycena olivaceomarginata]
MPKASKTQQARAANLLKNLSNIGTKTKRVWGELSPKKVTKWLSPRKKCKENIMADDATRSIEDASDGSIHASHAIDVSATEDPFRTSIQSFPIPGLTSVSPSGAPATRSFTWKLPTVEEVEDEDDRHSTYTFPAPESPHPLCSPSSSAPPPTNDSDDPRDSIDVPEAEDELLATSPSHGDDYPRPLAPRTFLEQMHEQATREGMHPLPAWGIAWY